MTGNVILLNERSKWHSRDVKYISGSWDAIKLEIPEFRLDDFKSGVEEPPNPFLKTVTRLPLYPTESEIPVGVVSNTYGLIQHIKIAELCIDSILNFNIDISNLTCELGLSTLGEWMNFRIYFPEEYSHSDSTGNKMALRLECFNSVDASSRLVIIFGWFRFVCSNGMVIGDTKIEIRDIHNQSINLSHVPERIHEAMIDIEEERVRLVEWQNKAVSVGDNNFTAWINDVVSKAIGIKAACRVYHISNSGFDVDFDDPFAKGNATEKPVHKTEKVPGAPDIAMNVFDVMQALSWIATQRNNAEEKLRWQSAIPSLLEKLTV